MTLSIGYLYSKISRCSSGWWLQNREWASTNSSHSLVKCCGVNILRRAPGYHRCFPFHILKVRFVSQASERMRPTHLHQVFKDSVQSSSADLLVCVSRGFTLWALMIKIIGCEMTRKNIRTWPVDWNLCIEDIDPQRWGPFWLSQPVQR